MKTATLTIKIPDDFEKGDGCRYCMQGEEYKWCELLGGIGVKCNADNCPLEILEINEDISCKNCYFYNSDGERCLECDDTYSLFMYPPDN